MVKKKMEAKTCSTGSCCGCMGWGVLVLGVLILLNSLYGWVTWGVFIGVIIILKGLIVLLHPKVCK
tara:strand:+ start:2009 stop:2206 length:198 start_codon:yes stop_codon:yes gene_type:complete